MLRVEDFVFHQVESEGVEIFLHKQLSIADRYLFCSSVEVRVQVLVLGMFSSRYTLTKSEHMVNDSSSRSKMMSGGHHKRESNH